MTFVRWTLASLILFGAPTLSAASETDAALKGKGLVEEKCARCHATDASSASPHEEAPPFRTFAARWPLEHLEEALAEGIVTGHPDMPAFAFEPDEIDAIIEYMYTLNPDADDTEASESKS